MPSPTWERPAATWVVARRRGVMHVFNKSPLALCVLAHRPFRASACACVRMCRILAPWIGAQWAVIPQLLPSGNRAVVWYPTPRRWTTSTIFFFFTSFVFTVSSHPPPLHPDFCPRLFPSLPLVVLHYLLVLLKEKPHYESYLFTLLYLSFWIKRKTLALFGLILQLQSFCFWTVCSFSFCIAATLDKWCNVQIKPCVSYHTEVGKLRSGGHMWPNELFNAASRAFTIIFNNSRKAKWREFSAWLIQKRFQTPTFT